MPYVGSAFKPKCCELSPATSIRSCSSVVTCRRRNFDEFLFGTPNKSSSRLRLPTKMKKSRIEEEKERGRKKKKKWIKIEGTSVKRTLALISVTLRFLWFVQWDLRVYTVIYEHCYKFREFHKVVVPTKKCSSSLVCSCNSYVSRCNGD